MHVEKETERLEGRMVQQERTNIEKGEKNRLVDTGCMKAKREKRNENVRFHGATAQIGRTKRGREIKNKRRREAKNITKRRRRRKVIWLAIRFVWY